MATSPEIYTKIARILAHHIWYGLGKVGIHAGMLYGAHKISNATENQPVANQPEGFMTKVGTLLNPFSPLKKLLLWVGFEAAAHELKNPINKVWDRFAAIPEGFITPFVESCIKPALKLLEDQGYLTLQDPVEVKKILAEKARLAIKKAAEEEAAKNLAAAQKAAAEAAANWWNLSNWDILGLFSSEAASAVPPVNNTSTPIVESLYKAAQHAGSTVVENVNTTLQAKAPSVLQLLETLESNAPAAGEAITQGLRKGLDATSYLAEMPGKVVGAIAEAAEIPYPCALVAAAATTYLAYYGLRATWQNWTTSTTVNVDNTNNQNNRNTATSAPVINNFMMPPQQQPTTAYLVPQFVPQTLVSAPAGEPSRPAIKGQQT